MKSYWHFLFLLAVGCTSADEVTLVWDNERAAGVRIAHSLLPSPIVADSVNVHVINGVDAIIGDVLDEPDGVLFTPFVPFTPGLDYEFRYGSRQIVTFTIPIDTTLSDPELLAVYPSSDTVPENLLKMYLTFSEPMMEGVSAKHVFLVSDASDTLRDTFLDLKPELWNAEGTVLTLWLDPGRIKRDLVPNKTMGKPIEQSVRYTLVVSGGWRSIMGAHTRDPFTKSFYTGQRDGDTPDPGKWKLETPAASTRDTLFIIFDEPMDFKLMTDAIHILDGQRQLLEGESVPGKAERSLCFIPLNAWNKGSYALLVEARLEDLAGNNINRLFDRDVLSEPSDDGNQGEREILFSIQ